MSDFNIHEMLQKANEEIHNNSNNKEALGIFRKIFNKLPESQLDSINFFVNTMPKDDDITLIVIKGHLLLEQQVRNIFISSFNNPEALKKSKFEISQIINIVEATFEKNVQNEYLWKCVKKLNNIRNDIAHNIENKGLKNKIEDLVAVCNKLLTSKIEDDESIESKLKSCIIGLGAQLISLATHSEEDRKYKEKTNYFTKMYQNDYVKFDNFFEETFTSTDYNNLNGVQIKEKKELDLFKKSLNNVYFKLIQLVDVTNSEYVHATYGALLAGRERAEKLTGVELKESIEALKIQHSNLIETMDTHFKDQYDEMMIKTTSELTDTLYKYLKNDTGI